MKTKKKNVTKVPFSGIKCSNVIIFAELTRFRKGDDRKAEELAEGQAEARTEMARKFKVSGIDIDAIVLTADLIVRR